MRTWSGKIPADHTTAVLEVMSEKMNSAMFQFNDTLPFTEMSKGLPYADTGNSTSMSIKKAH
jgi:hypothetical protein